MAHHPMRVILPSAGLLVLLAACAGPSDDTADGPSRRVIAATDLSLTLTRVEAEDGLRDEYDLRLSVTTNNDESLPVQSLTVVTPGGARLTADRSDVAAMDQIDPDFGIEVIRGFEAGDGQGHWTLAAIASLDPELFGDGTYTLTATYEGGADTFELWYGEPGTGGHLPHPSNTGFTSPDLEAPLTGPLTFTWEEDPVADFYGIFMAPVEGGEEKQAVLPAGTSSYGPHDYTPGLWGLELAVGVERQGSVDGVQFTISKATVLTLDRDVK